MRSLTLALLFSLATPALASIPELPTAIPTDAKSDVSSESAWRAHLSERRQLQIDRLRAYAGAGVFPLNRIEPGLLSQLLDANGNPCAMAHLMTLDGEGNLIAQLARTDNAIELGAQKRGPVDDWILTSGLTHAEVAFVQEPDFFIGFEPPEAPITQLEHERLRTHFLMAAAQLEATFDQGVENALASLGKRVHRLPTTT